MNWPPKNTILSSVLDGNFSQAFDRTKNYVKSGEILADVENSARLLVSGGTDVGAWAKAGAKAIGGYNGAGDLTGGYGGYLNKGASLFDLGRGGADKAATALKSTTGKNLMNAVGYINKGLDYGSMLAAGSGGIQSMTAPSPRYDATIQNQGASNLALSRNAQGLPAANQVSVYNPSEGGVLDPAAFEVKTSIPSWLIIGGAAYLLFFNK